MPITLLDRALEELESVGDLKQASTCFRWKPDPAEIPAGAIVPSFEEGRFRRWIVLAEAEGSSARERWVSNYYRGIVTPLGATLVIRAKDVVGIVFDNAAAVGGYIAFNNDDAVGGNVAASWQMPSCSFSVGISTIGLPSALQQRVEQLRQLPDGWDSYGSPPISHTAVEEAKNVVLQALLEEVGLPAPFVAPTSLGGVGLEWKLESGKELLLEISPTGDISYLLVVPRPDGQENEIEDVVSGPEELKKLLRSLSE